MGGLIQAAISEIGAAQARGETEKARKLYEGLLAKIDAIPDPELREQAAVLLGKSEAGEVRADPEMVAAQRAALAKLQQISDEGGLLLEDKAALSEQLGQAARADARGRSAIESQMQARGQLGSGAELAMKLQGQQASAQRGYENARDTAAMAQKRAYEAIMGRGRLAGDVRGQDFGERMASARARDQIAAYNAAAQERANRYNAGLPQQQFQNRLAKASAGLQGTNALAGLHQQGAQQAYNQSAGYGAAAGRLVEELGDYEMDQYRTEPKWKHGK